MDYKANVESLTFYLIVGGIMAFVMLMCVVFLVKSYRAGIKIGMDKKILRKTIISSATFTLLPSIAILLGVITLSKSLGLPFSWLRLSVIGALQYELNVAEIAAQSTGLSGLVSSEMTMEAFVTIALVMTMGIMGGPVLTTLFGELYLKIVKKKPKKESSGKPGFGAHATSAMFVGLCGAFIGSYVGKAFPDIWSGICKGIEKIGHLNIKDSVVNFFAHDQAALTPICVALVAAAAMAVFEYFIQKKNVKVLENFSLATSMLIAMAAVVVFGLVRGLM